MSKEMEQKIFEAKLIHAVRHFGTAWHIAQDIIDLADKYGIFDTIRFGNEEIFNTTKEKIHEQLSTVAADSEIR